MNIEREQAIAWLVELLLVLTVFALFIIAIQIMFGSLGGCHFMVCGPT